MDGNLKGPYWCTKSMYYKLACTLNKLNMGWNLEVLDMEGWIMKKWGKNQMYSWSRKWWDLGLNILAKGGWETMGSPAFFFLLMSFINHMLLQVACYQLTGDGMRAILYWIRTYVEPYEKTICFWGQEVKNWQFDRVQPNESIHMELLFHFLSCRFSAWLTFALLFSLLYWRHFPKRCKNASSVFDYLHSLLNLV